MPRKHSITAYRFEELSPKAKDFARDSMNEHGYNWADEALDSIKALAAHFGGRVKDYSIDFFGGSYSSMEFDMPEEMDRAEIKRRLDLLGSYNKKTLLGDGDCKLTGYDSDEDAIDGFRIAFIGGTDDLDRLMKAAFNSWLRACQANAEYQLSDEYMIELGNNNNYWYDANGRLVR